MMTQLKNKEIGSSISKKAEVQKEMKTKSFNEQSNETTNHLRLWISDDWYIPVNHKGQCVGQCNEGALGFVIQLRSVINDEFRMALKIPRLMSETHRENAYISDLMEQELNAVQIIFRGQGHRRGLLQAHEAAGLLQGPITIRSTREAQAWDNALVLVRYEKSQNPFFCLIKWVDNQLRKFPDDVDCPNIDADTFTLLQAKAQTSVQHVRDWSKTVFVELNDKLSEDRKGQQGANKQDPLAIFNVNDALEKDEVGRTWYTCLPSVMYPWAPYTLQETISLGKQGPNWTLDKHLQLVENICNGLYVLHSRGMIHADVRPANIVYQGEPENPQNYFLSDYGSLASASVALAMRRADFSGTTVIGPVVQGERTSVFYAPERSTGRERETADTAILIDPGGGGSLYIMLGWKSDLIRLELLDNNGKPNSDSEYYVKFINQLSRAEDDSANTYLQSGDRIQIRDYIFELFDSERIGHNLRALECKKEYWMVYHGRIVVKCSDNHFDACHSFPISRTIELLQWSASTDLYSLGVLALYSIYCYQLLKPDNRSGSSKEEVTTMPHNGKNGENDVSLVDERFQEMLTYLTNKSLFNAIWRRLEWLRMQVEKGLEQDTTPENFANLPFERHSELDSETKQRNLKDEAESVVSRITQTVPGTEELLKGLNYNLGSFVFYLHFVLRCLHRADDLEVKEEWMMVPFCQNRHESPEAGAVAEALRRLGEIREIIRKPALKGINADPKSIPGFDLRPETEIRADVQTLRENEKRLNKQIQTSQEREQQLSEELEALRSHKQEAQHILDQLQTELQTARAEKQEMNAEWYSVNEYIGRALKMMEDATKFNPFEMLRIFQEVKDNFWKAYRPSDTPKQSTP